MANECDVKVGVSVYAHLCEFKCIVHNAVVKLQTELLLWILFLQNFCFFFFTECHRIETEREKGEFYLLLPCLL